MGIFWSSSCEVNLYCTVCHWHAHALYAHQSYFPYNSLCLLPLLFSLFYKTKSSPYTVMSRSRSFLVCEAHRAVPQFEYWSSRLPASYDNLTGHGGCEKGKKNEHSICTAFFSELYHPGPCGYLRLVTFVLTNARNDTSSSPRTSWFLITPSAPRYVWR